MPRRERLLGEYDDTANDWLWQEIPMNAGEGMLEHIALDTNDIDDDQDTDEYRQYAVQVDFQETVWGLSDTSGGQVERYLYSDPYGVTSTEDASGAGIGAYATEVYHRKRLHGVVVDAVTELYDFRNRWMDPVPGGWLSRDPEGILDSANLYQVFLRMPLWLVDPFGSECEQPKVDISGSLANGMTGCVDLDADHGFYTGECEGGMGCTSASWEWPPPTADVQVEIDCTEPNINTFQCLGLITHEMEHVRQVEDCYVTCSSQVASQNSWPAYDWCMQTCLQMNWNEEEPVDEAEEILNAGSLVEAISRFIDHLSTVLNRFN